MSRSFQLVGLKEEAERWIDANCVKTPDIICPDCHRIISEKLDIVCSEQHDSFAGDGPTLNTYKGKDGSLVNVVIQDEPWASGPVCFLCLEIVPKYQSE
jgi:hypothetical protein